MMILSQQLHQAKSDAQNHHTRWSKTPIRSKHLKKCINSKQGSIPLIVFSQRKQPTASQLLFALPLSTNGCLNFRYWALQSRIPATCWCWAVVHINGSRMLGSLFWKPKIIGLWKGEFLIEETLHRDATWSLYYVTCILPSSNHFSPPLGERMSVFIDVTMFG